MIWDRIQVQDITSFNRQASVFQVKRAISSFLSIFGLERVHQDHNGRYIIRSMNLKSCIALLYLTTCAGFLLIFTGITFTWNLENTIYGNSLFLITDIVIICLWWLHCLVCVFSVLLEPDESAKGYYVQMQRFDDSLLTFKNKVYSKQRLRCNLMFFVSLTIHFLFLLPALIPLALDTFYIEYLGTIGYYSMGMMPTFTTLDYVVKLYLLRSRLTIFGKKLSEHAGRNLPSLLKKIRETKRAKGVMQHSTDKFYWRYSLLNEMCSIINNRYSMQVVLHFANVVVSAIQSIFGLTLLITNKYGENLTEYRTSVITYLLYTATIYFYSAWIIESSMSIERQYKDIILTTEIAMVYNTTLSERERESWTQLTALCRRQPIQLTACGFFKLDYSLLAGMLGTMFTYTILLTQLNSSNKKA